MFSLGLILLLLISLQCRVVENSENVPEYLVRRLRETKVQIAKEFIQRDAVPVISSSYDTKWVNLWSQKLHSERTLMVRSFNKMCILEGNRVISVAVQPATNETNSALQEVALIRQERPVKFVKSIFWKSKLYLLVCYDDDNACGLYTGNNEVEIKHKQIIKDKGWPMDATFFTRGNRLYLVVAHNTDEYPVSSVIYHWTGTYMDVIHQLLMVGVVSVTAFNYKNSTIIIFGQNEKTQPDIGSGIYKLDDNGINMIQYLPTNGPVSIHYYTHKEQIFLVVINKIEASNVYWWDGNEFLHWTDLPSIVAPSMVNVAHFNGDTLFFVSYESHVTVYKVSSSEYSRLNLLELKNGERVVDMGVWTDERGTLTLLLITVDPKNLYRIEPWELRIKKKPENANLKEAEGATEDCLSDLESRLNERVTPMENLAHKTWPLLIPSAKNINIGALNGSNRLGKLILQSGSIAKLDVSSSEGILLASEIETLAESSGAGGFRTIVNSILEESRKTMKIHGTNRLVGDVIIQGNAVFQGLQTNSIHTELFNGQSINLQQSVISKTKNQIFSNAQLRGKNIRVEELQIDQLCGIPYEYWLQKSNEKTDNIFLKNNNFDINNDTIIVKTDLLTINRLNLRSIDGVELISFFKDLFIPGENQRIRGNIIQSQSGTLKVGDLVVENLNGLPQKDLMTIHTNQNLENNVFAKTMLIQNLIAKKVNGVAVSESAMVSKKNHIKGQVTIASMRILDELAIENPSEFPKVRPVQVYDEVTIIGDMKSEDLSLEPYTNFFISLENGSVIEQSNIDSILDSYWTKSSSQIIENQVVFDSGLTVDELSVEYFNDLDISQDIMFTTVQEINEDFPSLKFVNFTTSGWIVEETEDPDSAIPLWSSTAETLFMNQEFRIERLGAQYLNIETFNGIPVVEIMNRNFMLSGPYKYPVDSVQRFDTVTINGRLETEDLNLRFFNGQQEFSLQDLLKFDANYTIKNLKAEKLTLENIAFISETGNESELNKFVNYLEEFTNSSESESDKEFSLIIDGQLEVENDLKVDVINHQSTEAYLEDLASQDFSVSSEEQLLIDSLVIHQNLSANFLHGSRIDSLLQNIFFKSRVQNLSDSRLSFNKISVDDLRTEKINKRLTSNFVYTDSYDIQLEGQAIFTNLLLPLDEDTQTKSLNGYPLNTLYDQLGEIDLLEVKDFTVNGNVSWESGGWSLAGTQIQLGPLDTIIKNALITRSKSTSNAPQIIRGQTRINSPREESPGVSVRWMKYKQDNSKLVQDGSLKVLEEFQGINMSQILHDAVLDDPTNDKEIEIISKKNFVQDLKASRLNVAGEIGIDSLNNWKVNDLYSSVIRKESLNTLINEKSSSRNSNGRTSRKNNQQGNLMIFRDQVTVKKLVIQPNEFSSVPVIHDAPVTAIVLSSTNAPDKYIPNNTYFKHVEVKGNAFVKTLDNVDLDEFVNDRVTIHSNHEVHGNLQFNGRVQVSNGAKIRTINGILPSDFVINNSQEDQIIVGEKTFNGDIEINGKTYAPSIAGINIKEEFDNGVLNYQDTEIFGDIIFKADIDRPVETINSTTHWQLNSAGGSLVNGMRLKSFLNDRDIEEENILRGLKRNESRLELSVIRASNASSHLPAIFYYFESEDELAITAAKVHRVEVIKIEKLTILNLYANEVSSYCGLKDKCPCRRQYVAEITSNSCDSREIEGSRIVYNFHEPHGVFGVTVTTTTVSSSKTCTTAGKNSTMEFTTISWIKSRPGNSLGEKVTENAMKIYGYLSDVEVFTQNDLIFIVLAIYYDPIEQSHETNSLIYLLDVVTNDLKLTQAIPTSHATGVQVFKIPSKGAHILFTSSGGSEFGKSSVSLLYRLKPSTAKFELLRTFTTGGTRYAKSVSQPKDEFLFLDDVATNSIHVYVYNPKWDNFYHYQSIYHNSMAPITSIETLYAGEFRRSQVYVIVTTKHDQFFVYEYKYFAKFQIIAQKKIKGILTMVPFDVSSHRYIFMGTETSSTILRVIEQGRN